MDVTSLRAQRVVCHAVLARGEGAWLLWHRHATRLEGAIPIFFFRLSVSREKKYPQVGFIVVWKGERELPTSCRELLGWERCRQCDHSCNKTRLLDNPVTISMAYANTDYHMIIIVSTCTYFVIRN